MVKNFFAIMRENRSWLMLAVLFFVGGITMSYTALSQEPELLRLLEETTLTVLQELGEEIFSGPPLVGIITLLMHNLLSTLQIIFMGIFLGLPTLASAIANGSVLGFLAYQLAQTGISPLPVLVAGILPHGIFELPAFFLSVALGLKLGYHVVFPLPELSRKDTFRKVFSDIGVSMPYIFGLLAISAIIEVLITPLILGSF
ncbi:MAG: stage II sporulation protein M [Firmicutes bacterium]|nr:stage II sporulation protein M [Bacillota bacterium]